MGLHVCAVAVAVAAVFHQCLKSILQMVAGWCSVAGTASAKYMPMAPQLLTSDRLKLACNSHQMVADECLTFSRHREYLAAMLV